MRALKTKRIIFKKEKQQKETIVTRRNTLTIKTILDLIEISFRFWQNKKKCSIYCSKL